MPNSGEAREVTPDPAFSKLLEDSAEDLYENAPCGYLSTLMDGTIAKVNETFLQWTGHTREDLVGRRRFQDLLPAGGRIFHETHYAPLLRMQGTVREVAVDIVRADGSRLPALINSVLKRDPAGQPMLVRTTVFDATDRREYERELVRERQRAEQSEVRAQILAQTLQASLIPPTPPAIPGLDVAAVYRPAGTGDEVGGDFYDVFELVRGNWALVIGDVCGKGAEAAGVTALARHTIRAAAVPTGRPRRVLTMLNQALLRQDVERFCTVLFARVHPDVQRAARVTLSSAGHPLPLRVSRSGRAAAVGRAGDLLGVFDRPVLHDTTVELRPTEFLVFYTDGVTEGRRDGDFFGDDRLHALLEAHRNEEAAAIATLILDQIVTFQAGLPRDDIAIVVLKVPDSAGG